MSKNNSIRELIPLEDYHPQQTPHALKVILGKQYQQKTRHFEVKIVTIEQFNMLALKVNGSMKNFEAGHEVRKGWKRLQDIIVANNIVSVEENEGIVFYDQANMVQSDGSIELSIGVKVEEIPYIPKECTKVTIPKRHYAKIECRCFSKEQMNLRYDYLNKWFKDKGYQIDNNSFSLEPNRLDSFNPFEIPADEIQVFDFDILYPIK
ncbi:GyrI-like domain-containing protein [Cytobacillus sp. IB215665]|uniref:GyrI-like domain-containing protein n=1 Tax=Cytobacillus sp. IB215665 TaxID=3097357 RepID=UPI002A0B838B|nr:GyrI-like domain-containing protein [Cytobacillus sp. IB215665]MDX8365832.1 GyrI-like domain-containing protein [Cytobacillus sp. IB215665]